MEDLFQIPENLEALSADELRSFIDAGVARVDEIAADPGAFTNEDRSVAELRSETEAFIETIFKAREKLAALEAESGAAEEAGDGAGDEGAEGDGAGDGDGADEGAAGDGDGAEGADADLSDLAAGAREEPAPIVAAAAPAPRPRNRPARSAAATPQENDEPRVSLVAAAGAGAEMQGREFPSEMELARLMIDRRRRFGQIPEGAEDNVPIARASWSHLYPDDRTIFGKDMEVQQELINRVIDPKVVKANFESRRKDADSLVASGGLCAPVTPYYNLMMISVADRPVRAALPAFNADRGGVRYANPASLAVITTGVGAMTVAQDQAGGTAGTKSCQTVACPNFVETDVEILYHCLRFGNLGARTFPERVAQWNNLVLAAHARLGERTLLTGIDTASTAVTANTLGLGASADLLGQILVARAGMISRHRMSADAVLRVLLPDWVKDLIVSDVYRSQFQRWDMTPAKFVALLRQGGVEPSFYLDSAAGKGQEFGTQSAGTLLEFPSTVTWYLFPEGSFLYVDGGVLELGLVRDSVLNSTNDFEIFGESFENVAFIGVESLAVTSTLCDTGITAGTHNTPCPVSYANNS